MNALMLLTALGATLVLRTGEQIEVDGAVREENGRAIFRSVGGVLYSLPSHEIDREAGRTVETNLDPEPVPALPPVRLKVSQAEKDRLLRELERNHGGSAPPVQPSLDVMPPLPTRADEAARSREEWDWRYEARRYEDAIRHTEENLALLVGRAARLEGEIRGLLSFGFRPNSFAYQTFLLQAIREQIPQAELEVIRARRDWDQFRDDARRQGVLPGWLR